MLRLRWSDHAPDDRSTPLDWPIPAVIVATLFLNLPFWCVHNLELWVPGPLTRYAYVVVAGALLITVLFFLGPALAAQAARRPLLGVVENSLGLVPALGLRVCCVVFLVRWIADVVEVPALWFLPFIFRRKVTLTESGLIAAGILAFVLATGVQSPRTTAKMAAFTNKLAIAILIAALLRVHEGWPAILKGFTDSDARSAIVHLWQGLAVLSLYVAPLAFLAADFGNRIHRRQQVATIALVGFVLPLSGTLFVIGAIDLATAATKFYQPSLEPNVTMALWGHAARRYLPGLMMVAAITMFGAVRFGIRVLAESVSMLVPARRLRWIVFGCLAGDITWLSLQDYYAFMLPFELSATCLAVAAAVLTADFVIARRQGDPVRNFDWVGVAALLSGCAAPFYLPQWMVGTGAYELWHPWLLPSYAIGFLACMFGRTLQKQLDKYATEGSGHH